MPRGDDGSAKPAASSYDEAMDALSSLITKRSRADKSNKGDRFDFLFDYVKMLDLEEPISKINIIHVAGTKGKGSTCTFAESILRHCGFHTGVFTSPHLIDIRERFRLDGVDICEEKFLAYFWWCWHRLKEKTSDDMPMPTYFRFLALLAFKIFSAEQVQTPTVCGISSLGYDHMEILGNTLGEIAGEKAGIFKQGVPAFTVPQPEEAMRVLEEKASQLNVPIKVAPALDAKLLNGLNLGLHGEHQYLNAGLAIALCSTWLQRTGRIEVNNLEQNISLPENFLKGLTTATLQGRAQIVPDQFIDIESLGGLVFYLDGAHSPESMEVCAKWFCLAIKEGNKQELRNNQQDDFGYGRETPRMNSAQILLFNCMSVRDPWLLFPRLVNACANHGVHFKKALFVPNMSVYNRVCSSALPPTDSHVDLSWQLTLQKVWENLINSQKDKERCGRSCENGTVFHSLPLAVKWLRDTVQQDKSVRLQVLVTGSLHLIGDLLRLVKK